MNEPIPVDLNKLKSILGNAKKVMAKVEETVPLYGKNVKENYNNTNSSPMYDSNDEREPVYPTPTLSYNEPITYSKEHIMASNLPLAIKEAMIKNPIPKITNLPPKFTLEEIGDLDESPKKTLKKSINENKNINQNDYIRVNITELNEIIEKKVNEIISKMFVKTLTEQTIKQTVNTLVKEGKLITNKKN